MTRFFHVYDGEDHTRSCRLARIEAATKVEACRIAERQFGSNCAVLELGPRLLDAALNAHFARKGGAA